MIVCNPVREMHIHCVINIISLRCNGHGVTIGNKIALAFSSFNSVGKKLYWSEKIYFGRIRDYLSQLLLVCIKVSAG